MNSQQAGYRKGLLGATAVYLLVMLFYGKDMFALGSLDGFYSQVNYVHNNLGYFDILAPVHYLRYAIAYPFFYMHQNGVPDFFQALVYVAYLSPFYFIRQSLSTFVVLMLLLIAPFGISYRSCLVIAGLFYLYFIVYMGEGRRLIFWLSAALATLSSGVLIAWILICLLYKRSIRISLKNYTVTLFVFSLLLGCSVVHKIGFFDRLSPAKVSVSMEKKLVKVKEPVIAMNRVIAGHSDNFFIKVVRRSTLYVTWVRGNFTKFYFYVTLLSVLVCATLIKLREGLYPAAFFAVGIPGFLVEGLGSLAFSLCALAVIVEFLQCSGHFRRLKTIDSI
ncbi:hypothetical protein [Marinobacterium jannaschii]|uniref:hypothetical protein n=1 Tax=Marinobacterium jannaschii TaxID=64970 RepID=UPI000B2E392E|nr:hypothetical protein [Marinobacterium jannaschii]